MTKQEYTASRRMEYLTEATAISATHHLLKAHTYKNRGAMIDAIKKDIKSAEKTFDEAFRQ